MVLELRTPHGTTWATLREDLPVLRAYVLSFVLIGIYWNNHHHMLAAVTRISGMTLWANQHLLFWRSPSPGCRAGSGLATQGPHGAVCGVKGHHFRVADGHAPAGTPSGGSCAGSFSTPSAASTSDHKSSRSRLTCIGR